jgi:hypothetical protein
MRKSVVIAAVLASAAMVFAQEAQYEEVQEVQEVQQALDLQAIVNQALVTVNAAQAAQAELELRIARMEAEAAAAAEVIQEPAAPVAPATPAAPAFPRIRQSGSVGFTPRMETIGRWDADGEKEDVAADANFRRFMLTWQYRLSVAVNEKLDMTFRLTDPSGNAGEEVWGSGKGSSATATDLLTLRLTNASFTWKPTSVFHFSAGLLDVASNTALDMHVAYVRKDPRFAFVHYGNSLAGMDFSFPINPNTRLFATAGIADNPMKQTVQIGEDTIPAHNNARIILGADLAFNERKITARPTFNMVTGNRILIDENGNEFGSVDFDRGAGEEFSNGVVLSQGLDMGFRIAPQFSLNFNLGALQDVASDFDRKTMKATGGIEPVVTFGGENNRLFTARVRYALDALSDNSDNAVSDEYAIVHFIDARLAIAVNQRLSITPRFRHWTSNGTHGVSTANGGWYNRAFENYGKDNDTKRSWSRFELGFASSF